MNRLCTLAVPASLWNDTLLHTLRVTMFLGLLVVKIVLIAIDQLSNIIVDNNLLWFPSDYELAEIVYYLKVEGRKALASVNSVISHVCQRPTLSKSSRAATKPR